MGIVRSGVGFGVHALVGVNTEFAEMIFNMRKASPQFAAIAGDDHHRWRKMVTSKYLV